MHTLICTHATKAKSSGGDPLTGSKASQRYAKENVLKVIVGINRRTEPELVEKVESVENRSGYIKDLIRADIASQRAEKAE